ncbi:hypothetical protein [Rhizobium sp. PAMB 3182]
MRAAGGSANLDVMEHPQPTAPSAYRLLLPALALSATAAVFGAAFSGWLAYGTDIFLTMAENGLSNCF